MKVKDFIKKVNGHLVEVPVILSGADGKTREAVSFDFSGYSFEEQDRMIVNIGLFKDKVVVNYK